MKIGPLYLLCLLFILENCSKGTMDDVPVLTFANGLNYSCNMGYLCANPVKSSIQVGIPQPNGYTYYSGAFSFTNSDNLVATYDPSGNIYPLKPGTCTITAVQAASQYNARASASFKLTILPPVPKLSWYQSNFHDMSVPVYINVGDTLQDYAISTIQNGGEIVYSSSDNSVATVNALGIVIGLKKGSTMITAIQKAKSNINVETSAQMTITVDPIPVLTFTNGNKISCSLSSKNPCTNVAISTVVNGGEISYSTDPNFAFTPYDGSVQLVGRTGTTTVYAFQALKVGFNGPSQATYELTIIP